MFEYIGRLRKSGFTQPKISREIVHKKTSFVSAADIFNALPDEQRTVLQVWFDDRAEGEKAKSEGELIAQIRAMEAEGKLLETTKQELIDKWNASAEEISELEADVTELQKEIDVLEDADHQLEIEGRDEQINKLTIAQTKLKDEIKKLNESPDLNFYLIECVRNLKDINAVLKPIVEHPEKLNQVMVEKFKKALQTTLKIIEKGTQNQNDPQDQRMIE